MNEFFDSGHRFLMSFFHFYLDPHAADAAPSDDENRGRAV
jgi:hypothetical protein